jgi:spermidine synthase
MPHVVGLAALAGALTLGAACFRRRPSALVAPATLAASGWAGITLEVVILFAFQGLYGYVYEQLGVLFAAFMVGLAAGCYLAAPRATAGDRLMGLTMAQALLALLAATMPMLFQRFAAAGIGGMGETVGLAALNLVVGGLTGYQFPLAAAVVIEDPSHAAGRSGLVYGLDLAGSSLGALVSGALLIPVLGLASTCSAVSVVMVVCAACQFVAMGLEAERAAAGRITLPPAPPTRPTPPSA